MQAAWFARFVQLLAPIGQMARLVSAEHQALRCSP